MKSPCNKVCVMDPASGLCKGCFRTLDEIARWGTMSDAQRDQVLVSLPGRKKDSNLPEVPVPPFS